MPNKNLWLLLHKHALHELNKEIMLIHVDKKEALNQMPSITDEMNMKDHCRKMERIKRC